MAYYLQMDGVDDYLKTPSIMFTDIYIDAIFEQAASKDSYYFDARAGGTGYAFRVTAGTDSWAGYTLRVDGVIKTNGTTAVPSNQRLMLRGNAAAVTDDVTIFSRNNAANFLKGKIYSVQFYNGATLVASYDMNTQTVQDQSGNGNHATLTGGTWVNDATGTSQEGAASITGVSTITASATVIPAAITGSASLQGIATVSATADVVNAPMLGSASLQGVGTATATASIIRSGSANIMGVSTLTASAAGLSVLGGASLTGVGWVMCSAIEGQFIVSVVNLEFEVLSTVQLESSIERVVNLEALLTRIVALEGEL